MLTKQGKIVIWLFLFTIVITVAAVAYVLHVMDGYAAERPMAARHYSPSLPAEAVAFGEAEPALAMVGVNRADIIDTGYMALINHSHGISADPNPALLSMAWPAVPVNVIEGTYLHNTALKAVEQLFYSARQNGIYGLFVSSGFRGLELQRELYAGGANSAFVMPPGHSEHHTGLAVDILATGVAMADLGISLQGRWLAENSYRYGLILRYPQGAERVTGIQFEPWHFRYVGRPHAYYMFSNNLVLEEYIMLIQERQHFTINLNGITYHVLHQRPQSDIIDIPYGMEATISSDNMGGYIITAR